MQQVAADLHLHSCLSPCADITMVPGEVTTRLVARGIRVASVTDHNACCNAYAFARAFDRAGILFVPGVEVTTREEVHILCYFETLSTLWEFARTLFRAFPRIGNDPDRFGYQLICNEHDEFVGQFPFLLSMASFFSIDDLVDLVHERQGVAIPSHLDRRSGLLYQLGIIPEKPVFTTYEIAHKTNMQRIAGQISGVRQFVSNSDAHNLDSIGPPRYVLNVEDICVQEILLALQGEHGRGVRLL